MSNDTTVIDHDTGEIADAPAALMKIETARILLSQARTVDEVKDIRDKAEALRMYMRQQRASLEAQNHCAEIKLRAERRAGEILQAMPKNEGGRPVETSNTVLPVSEPTLKDMGIEKMQASRWQTIAALPKEDFEVFIAETKASGKELTTASVLGEAKEFKRQQAREQRAAAPAPIIPPSITLEHRDNTEHIKDNSVNLILTDPPYGISAYKGVTKIGNQIVSADFDGDDDWDSIDPAQFLDQLYDWAEEWERVLKPGGAVVTFMDRMLVSYLWDTLKRVGLQPKNTITWVKTNPSPASLARRNLISATELIVWAVKPGAPYTFNEVDEWDRRNVLVTPIIGGHERVDHPTQKPLAILRRLMLLTSNPGDLVLDPFAGSGSTGAAALELGRNAHLIERDVTHFQTAQHRLGTQQEAA